MSEFNPEVLDQSEARRAMRLASYASVTVALILIVAKTSTRLITGSVAVLSILVGSLLDAIARVVTLLAIQHSHQPPDHEHRSDMAKSKPLPRWLNPRSSWAQRFFCYLKPAQVRWTLDRSRREKSASP